MRTAVPTLLLLAACIGDSQADLLLMKADQAALESRIEALEARMDGVEAASAAAPVPVPPPVEPPAPAPVPAPLRTPAPERPLAIPMTPAPAPTPVVPTGPVGKVTVSSPRDGESITVDGVLRSERTPAVLMLPTGRHTVQVGGHPAQEIKVIEGESVLVVPR